MKQTYRREAVETTKAGDEWRSFKPGAITRLDTEPAVPNCAAQHFGPWLCHLPWLSDAVAAYRAGDLKPRAAVSVVEASEDGPRVLYVLDDSGIATISIVDQMQKHDSSFGGTSTVRTRRAIRLAVADDEVKGIMLRIDDAPGGTVSGTTQLADDIVDAAASKPLHAHGDDMVASAALWVASQASRFTVSRSTDVGSIGVVAVVYDTSGEAEAEGIKVHVVSTGDRKGDFAWGVPVSEGAIEELQREVDSINELFMDAIAVGRRMTGDQVKAVATGQVWLAAEAKGLGLIDEVETFDQAFANLAMVVEATRDEQAVAADRSRRAAAALALGR